jgi:choline dehydrogenase
MSEKYQVKNHYGTIPLDIEQPSPALSEYGDVEDEPIEVRGIRYLRDEWSSMHSIFYRPVKRCSCRCFLSIAMLILSVSLGGIFVFNFMLGPSDNPSEANTFDYIVIGAGPAGSIITNKLVSHGAKVLLLEAGGPTQHATGGTDSFGGPISRFDIPMLWSSLMINSTLHWRGFNVHGIVQGKGLGGCGVHTAMIYIRAIESDIRKWSLPSWTWSSVLEHMLRLEDYGSDDIDAAELPYYHRKGGVIRNVKAPYIDPIAPKFVQAAQEYGFKFTRDFNDPSAREGVGYYDFNIRNGIRDGVAARLLGPLIANKLSNFNLQLHAVVRRVILSKDKDSSSHTAIGVEYEQNGVIKTAYTRSYNSKVQSSLSRSGVVIAGGALLTPKILQNSGIGAKERLSRLGVPLQVDSPQVGRNAQDHGATQVLFRVNSDITAFYPIAYNVISKYGQYVDAVERGLAGEHVSADDLGVFGSSGLAGGAFLVSPYSTDGIPDIQLTVFPSNIFDHGALSQIKPPVNPWLNSSTLMTSPASSMNTMVIAVALMYSDTRYDISLNASNPIHGAPRIQYQGEQELEERDLLRMTWGIETARKIARTAPLSDIITDIVSPSLDITVDMLPTWILANHHPYAHWVGSARMGSSIDNSVVSESGKVHGVENLFVGDASIIPLLPNGNIHTLVTAVASEVADRIIGQEVPFIVFP